MLRSNFRQSQSYPRSQGVNSFARKPVACPASTPFFRFSSTQERIGVRVKLMKSETSVAATITPANGTIIVPIRVLIIITGTNTTTLVSALADTAAITSSVPRSAAVLIDSPRSRCLKMFSITTMELVTSTPTEQPSDSSVMMLNE